MDKIEIEIDVYENTTGYLKNHWTNHKACCTHFDVFSMLNSNMGMKFNTFNFCEKYEILTLLCAVVRAELWNNNW